MKKLLIITVCLLGFLTQKAFGDSGVCGDDATWTFENGVLTITGTGAMYDSQSWSSYSSIIRVIVGEGITSISNSAFSTCSGIDSVSIPNSLNRIGNSAFANCSQLRSIFLPDSVTAIGDGAFSGCTGLKTVTSLNLVPPAMGTSVFSGVNLSGATLSTYKTKCSESLYDSVPEWKDFGIRFYTDITVNATRIALDTTTLSLNHGDTVRLTATIEPIDATCRGITWGSNNSRIATVDQSGLVTAVGGGQAIISVRADDGGFDARCTVTVVKSSNANLDTLVVSRGILTPDFHPDSTAYTVKLDTLISPVEITAIANHQGATVEGNGKCQVSLGENDLEIKVIAEDDTTEKLYTVKVTLPYGGKCGDDSITWNLKDSVLTVGGTGKMYDYTGEVNVPWYPWKNSIKQVVVEEGITRIGDSVFSSCYYLDAVSLPPTLTAIGEYAFDSCSALKSIAIPESVTDIGRHAFSYCNKLQFINLSPKIKIIRDYLLAGCGNLTSIVIPDGVTNIGKHAFARCKNVKSVIIPNSVIGIEEYAFSSCEKLDSVIFPEDIINIKTGTFSHCYNLTHIEFPEHIIGIDSCAFEECRALKKVKILNPTPPATGGNVFRGSNTDYVMLWVPPGASEKYKKSDTWKAFGTINEILLSTDATLKFLTVSGGGTLVPAFHTDSLTYTVQVEREIERISFDFKVSHEKALLYNRTIPGTAYSLNVGRNVFEIGVMAEDRDSSRFYHIYVQRGELDTGFWEIGKQQSITVWMQNNILHVDSQGTENITVYSVGGALVGKFSKQAGKFPFTLNTSENILIVKGSSGWVCKIITNK